MYQSETKKPWYNNEWSINNDDRAEWLKSKELTQKQINIIIKYVKAGYSKQLGQEKVMFQCMFKEWAKDNNYDARYYGFTWNEDSKTMRFIREKFYDGVGRTRPNVDVGLSKGAIAGLENFVSWQVNACERDAKDIATGQKEIKEKQALQDEIDKVKLNIDALNSKYANLLNKMEKYNK
jgi:hypothetical protein